MKPGWIKTGIFGFVILIISASCAPASPAVQITLPAESPTPAAPATDTALPTTEVTPAPLVTGSLPAPTQLVPTQTTGIVVMVGTAIPGGIGGLSTPLPPVTGTLTSSGGSLVVTLADEGKTVAMHPGERFLLQLGAGYVWDVTVADPKILSRVVNVTVVRGAQGIYEAHQVGATQLTASGDPECRSSNPPCAMPSIMFTINVVVQ